MFKYVLMAMVLCTVAIFSGAYGLPDARVSEETYEQALNMGLPILLSIPKLALTAPIEHVGLMSDGTLEVPVGPSNVAWFNAGPRPGEEGSAVIDGHFGWKDSIPAAFDQLHALVKGDMIYVTDDNGFTTVFVVRELRLYGEHEDASIVFNSKDAKAHLNLITCAGAWDRGRKSYSERLIVFADKAVN